MAITYGQIYQLSLDTTLQAQIAVAITHDAQLQLAISSDPVILKWATGVVSNAMSEAKKWQMMVCRNGAVGDAAFPVIPEPAPQEEVPQPTDDLPPPIETETPPAPVVPQPVPDNLVQTAVTELVGTMAAAYDRANPDPVR